MSISAPGKVILFGEHAVVYGCPALAASIDASVTLAFKKIASVAEPDVVFALNFVDFTDKSINLKSADFDLDLPPSDVGLDISKLFLAKSQQLLSEFNITNQVLCSVATILLSCHLLKSRFHVHETINGPYDLTFTADLPVKSGLGSSAAYCSVVATFFLHIYGIIAGPDLSTNELFFIQSFAHELEKIMHALPSGVDTTISTCGGLVLFRKDPVDSKTTTRPLLPPLWKELPKLVIINTHTPRSTADIVNSVKIFRQRQPDLCAKIFEDIAAICERAENVFSLPLNNDPFDTLAGLFLLNHEALVKLGVSNSLLDEIVSRLQTIKFGAKLTGAGRGGCVIALPRSKSQSLCAVEKVRNILHDLDVSVFEVTICVPGIRLQINKNANTWYLFLFLLF